MADLMPRTKQVCVIASMERWMAAKTSVKVGADREIARPAEVSAAAAHGRFQIQKFATVMEGGVEL